MSLRENQYFAFVALLITIGIPIGSAVNGPILPIDPSEYPYLVMVKDANFLPRSGGVFLSKRFVLLEPDVATEPNPLVYSGGQQYTVVSKWSTTPYGLSVFKLCTSPAFNGPYYNFAPAAHSTFTTNQTGKVLFYGQNGTLFGHTADVVTNNICVSELVLNGGQASLMDTSKDVCIAYQRSDCSAIKSLSSRSYPVLAVNGIVEAVFKNDYCSLGITPTSYSLPSIYRKIMPYKTEILASPGIVVANP